MYFAFPYKQPKLTKYPRDVSSWQRTVDRSRQTSVVLISGGRSTELYTFYHRISGDHWIVPSYTAYIKVSSVTELHEIGSNFAGAIWAIVRQLVARPVGERQRLGTYM